jgi:hypothetical protein
MKIYFDHEKLDVYRDSIAFCTWGEFLPSVTTKASAKEEESDYDYDHEQDANG